MDNNEKQKLDRKRGELKALLFRLAKAQDLLKDQHLKSEIYRQLEEIYTVDEDKKFRHFYSDFFPILVEVSEHIELGSTDVLVTNLKLLVEGYQSVNPDKKGNFIDISDNICKLYDHVNLDVARLNYHSAIMNETKGDVKKINEKINEFNDSLKENKNILEKTDNLEKNYITILGIFAAIVLAFTGGIAFSTSVLENIDNVSPFRLALVIIGLAFVLINVVYILTRFIQEINKEKGVEIKYPVYMRVLNLHFILIAIAIIIVYFENLKYGFV